MGERTRVVCRPRSDRPSPTRLPPPTLGSSAKQRELPLLGIEAWHRGCLGDHLAPDTRDEGEPKLRRIPPRVIDSTALAARHIPPPAPADRLPPAVGAPARHRLPPAGGPDPLPDRLKFLGMPRGAPQMGSLSNRAEKVKMCILPSTRTMCVSRAVPRDREENLLNRKIPHETWKKSGPSPPRYAWRMTTVFLHSETVTFCSNAPAGPRRQRRTTRGAYRVA